MPEETKQANPVPPEAETSPVLPVAAPTAVGKPGTASANPAGTSASAQVTAGSPATPETTPPEVAAQPAAKVAKPAPAPPKPEAPKPEPWNSDLVESLKAQYGSGIKEASAYLGQQYLVADSSLVYEILLRMYDEHFDYCVDVTAVHYPQRELQFDIVYILYSFRLNQRVRIKTQVKDGEAARSACAIWPTANWLEREVFDMFGIVFNGHPDLKRILMPEGWKGHPLRKDYPILRQDQEWVKANIGIESGQ